jgi:uncharacterized protein (UPF0335 family)
MLGTKDELLGFIENYLRIENERKLLGEDLKMLFEDAKEKFDVKALRAAIRVAKIRAKLGEDEQAELDQMLEVVDGKVI